MPYRRTEAELAQLHAALTRPRFFDGERITVEFTTDPALYRRLLPPPLLPVSAPIVVVGIGAWDSNNVGRYRGGSLSLLAQYQGIDGGAAVCMWMDSDAAIQFGRDVLGEPKKRARASIVRTGDRVHAWIERDGMRIIELHAVLGPDLGPSDLSRFSYNFRSRPSVDGFHLDEDVTLTRTEFVTSITERRPADVALTLRSTMGDPLAEIPILQVRGAEYQRHDIIGRTEAVARVDPAVYLPFHYGRQDPLAASPPPTAPNEETDHARR